YEGPDSFTVTTTGELGGSTSQVITVDVSLDSEAVITGDFTGTSFDGAPATGDLDATDPDGDVTYAVSTDATNGTATIDPDTGEWSYTPDAGYEGPDSFTVTTTDELGGTTTQVITVDVSLDSEAVITGDTTRSSSDGAPATGDLDATDADGDVTYAVSTDATNGTA